MLYARSEARRILFERGERIYELWVKECYKCPFLPHQAGYDPRFAHRPLTRQEELNTLESRERWFGRIRQEQIDEYLRHDPGLGSERIPSRKPIEGRVQTLMDEFMVPKEASK